MIIKSIFFQLILISLSLFFFSPQWMTNDDPGMMMIVSGQYSGLPDPHLIFSNILLGYLMTYLYHVYKELNWYTVFHLSVIFSSLSVISYFILYKTKNNTLFHYLAIIFISILAYTNLQFTITAAISASAALTIIMHQTDKKDRLLLSIIFMTLAVLVRWQIIFIILFYMIIMYLLKLYSTRQLLFFFLSFFISLILITSDVLINNDNPAWKSYKKYDIIRGQILGTAKLIDYNATWQNGFPTVKSDIDSKQKLADINWSCNDANLLLNWAFIANNKYSESNLSFLNQNFKSRKNFKEILSAISVSLENNLLISFFVFIVLLIFFLSNKKSSILLTFFLVSLIFLITYIQRMPSHLYIAICVIAIIPLLSKIQIPSKYFVLPFFLIVFILLYNQFINSQKIIAGDIVINEIYASLSSEQKVALVAGKSFPYQYLPLLLNKEKNSDLIGLGWINDSPLNNSMLTKYKINDFNDIVNRKDVVLISPEPVIKMVMAYLEENYTVESEYKYEKIKEINASAIDYGKIIIWKIIAVSRR